MKNREFIIAEVAGALGTVIDTWPTTVWATDSNLAYRKMIADLSADYERPPIWGMSDDDATVAFGLDLRDRTLVQEYQALDKLEVWS